MVVCAAVGRLCPKLGADEFVAQAGEHASVEGSSLAVYQGAMRRRAAMSAATSPCSAYQATAIVWQRNPNGTVCSTVRPPAARRAGRVAMVPAAARHGAEPTVKSVAFVSRVLVERIAPAGRHSKRTSAQSTRIQGTP